LGLPAAIRRLRKTLITALCLMADCAAMHRTLRTWLRPPQIPGSNIVLLDEKVTFGALR
jgi:hypothetical protein